jgi:hypothetical protein
MPIFSVPENIRQQVCGACANSYKTAETPDGYSLCRKQKPWKYTGVSYFCQIDSWRPRGK